MFIEAVLSALEVILIGPRAILIVFRSVLIDVRDVLFKTGIILIAVRVVLSDIAIYREHVLLPIRLRLSRIYLFLLVWIFFEGCAHGKARAWKRDSIPDMGCCSIVNI